MRPVVDREQRLTAGPSEPGRKPASGDGVAGNTHVAEHVTEQVVERGGAWQRWAGCAAGYLLSHLYLRKLINYLHYDYH